MSQRLVVVSDLHLAGSGPLNNFHAGEELASLVGHFTFPETTLAIGGDGFDFLQLPERCGESFVMDEVPALLERTLETIRQESWGPKFFEALRKLLDTGGRLVILPGNHDPELFHPEARRILLRALGISTRAVPLEFHSTDVPWNTSVGRWQVDVGHGHRRDPWNDVEPAALARSLETGEPAMLPPGSRLVLQVLNRFKEAVTPSTGAARFPFVDLLKPETPAVPLLLLYLDPRMALPELKKALGFTPGVLVQQVRGLLRDGGPMLGRGQFPAGLPGDELLARYIVSGFSEQERRVPEACLRQLESLLAGATEPEPGTLAAHGGKRRFLLRAFLRAFSADGTFFDPSKPSAHDLALIQEHLAPRAGPRVLITGHTHAARKIELEGDRMYLNTGTWTDLMRVPPLDDDQTVQKFADDLETGNVPRLRRLTYAEVTPEGPSLKFWGTPQ